MSTVIHYLPLRGKIRGSINEHECSYFYRYSNEIQIISLPMRIEHSNPNSKSQSEMSLVLTGLLTKEQNVLQRGYKLARVLLDQSDLAVVKIAEI